jgi:hypothetical protein
MPSSETEVVDGRGLEPLRERGSDDNLDELVRARIAVRVALDILEPLFNRTGYTTVREAIDALREGIRPREST